MYIASFNGSKESSYFQICILQALMGINFAKFFILVAEMSGIRNSKTRDFEKPFPGCLGRMVNLFELSASMHGNRMLTDRPHQDGEVFFA